MAKRIKLNPATDAPTSRNDLSLDYMLGYVALNGSDEDKKWYIKLVEKNTEMKDCALPKAQGKKVSTTKQAVVREAFCERFFPQFCNKNEKLSYLDKVKKALK